MSELTLLEDLLKQRAERPDEWTMDRFVRKARKLEDKNLLLCKLAEKAETYAYKTFCDYQERWGKNSNPAIEAFEIYNNIYNALRVASTL